MGGRLTPALRRWFPRSLVVTLGLAALAGGCKKIPYIFTWSGKGKGTVQ